MSVGILVCDPGVLELQLGGVITAEGMKRFFAGATREFPADTEVLLVRFDNVLVACSAEVLTQGHDVSEVSIRRLRVPGAVVCRPEDLDFFREHARQVAQYGATRVPFTSLERAREWARRRVAALRLARERAPRALAPAR
jgi:hypothetical protein